VLPAERLSLETDLDVGIVLGVDGVNEPDLVGHGGHDQAVSADALAEETDAP
jgi:hypothetical protein